MKTCSQAVFSLIYKLSKIAYEKRLQINFILLFVIEIANT